MLSHRERARKLVDSMTLQEKVSQMVHEARGISHLNIPSYNWWNECLHGVGRAGIATVFPQAIGMAAMFDDTFLQEIASVISDEVRAKYNQALIEQNNEKSGTGSVLPEAVEGKEEARRLWYLGLTCWTPNINIFRDPRWGRGHETYGEDPYLTSRLGVAFVKGLQGDDPKYLKTVATPKHFAVHSGPEKLRHEFDAIVNQKDLYETYLPAFKACVQEGKAASIMSAYNAVNGEPASASPTLLQKILRDEWGFEGFVVSDCGAIRDIRENHKKTKSLTKAAAMAVNAGCDLNCGSMYDFLAVSVKKGYITEETIDKSLIRLFEARNRLGMFDAPEDVVYNTISPEVIDCKEHREIALEASRRSMVLLKNDGILPFKKDLKKIALIGPNADSIAVLLANYNGTPSSHITLLEGMRKRFQGQIIYEQGCHLYEKNREDFDKALQAALEADVIVLCLGLAPELEGEEGDAFNADASGDKLSLNLPGVQEELMEALAGTDTPMAVVITTGSALDLRKVDQKASAVLQAWYPGQDGGLAIAELLCGDYCPSGRLPVSFVQSDDDLPPFEDYSMKGRTYRYLEKPPLYPFGYGLSYSAFDYSDLQLEWKGQGEKRSLSATVTVTNTAERHADEIVQFYLKRHNSSLSVPNFQLCEFSRISINAGETITTEVEIPLSMFEIVDDKGKSILKHGQFTIFAGGQQPDRRSEELMGKSTLNAVFNLEI